MSDDIAARMATQKAEFDACEALAKQMRRINMTAVVDDDYPNVRYDYEQAVRTFLDACRANGRSITPSERTDFVASRPTEAQEWCWHMDLHETEHDERHAGLALRAAWPHVRKWLETVEGYWRSVVAALPVSVANKWRGNYASFYNGYWYVRRTHADRAIIAARTASLEEAALACESARSGLGNADRRTRMATMCAEKIRGLKS